MISARLIVKLSLSSLAVSGVAFLLVAYGINGFRVIGFLSVLGGVAAIAVGLIGMATGMLKNDLKD